MALTQAGGDGLPVVFSGLLWDRVPLCRHMIVGLRHGMIMEITAPRAQLADLEEENLSLKEKMRKEVQDEYESLVQDLFVTCVHLKGNLDVYRLSIEQRLFEIISKVRREGVGDMIDLKKKFGFTKNNGDLKEHLSKIVMLVFTSSRLHSTTLDCTGGFDLKWMARNTVAFNCSTDSKI
nr:coiled-coil domain-containing protein 162-like [Columba livia]